MPQMANITVKAANGTTDVVYNAMTPSSGDKTDAVWRVESASTFAAFRPVFSMKTRSNGSGSARRAEINAVYPYAPVVPEGQKQAVVEKIPVSFTIVLPSEVPDSVLDEAIHQIGNLLSSPLVRSSLRAGYAPT